MGSRATQFPQTYVLKAKFFPLVLQGAGSGKAPTLKYGDPNGAFFYAPVFVSTGIWTIATVDGWYQHLGVIYNVMQATGAGTNSIQLSPTPVSLGTTLNAAGNAYSWKFTFNTFLGAGTTYPGSAADLLVGDQVNLFFSFCDSQEQL